MDASQFRVQVMCKWDAAGYAIDTLLVQRSALEGDRTVGSLLGSAPEFFGAVGASPLAFRLEDGVALSLEDPLHRALAGSGLRFVTRQALAELGTTSAVFEASERVSGARDGLERSAASGLAAPSTERFPGAISASTVLPHDRPARTFQELRSAQRLFVDIPAGYRDWVDTGLSPQALGGRRVKIGFWAKVAVPDGESEHAFKARMDNLVLRLVLDESREIDWRHYKVDEKERDDLTPVEPGAMLRLGSGKMYSFACLPGRIEVRLGGTRSSDCGTVRTVYLMSRVAQDDVVMCKGSVHEYQTFDLDLERFPDPPDLPEPRP